MSVPDEGARLIAYRGGPRHHTERNRWQSKRLGPSSVANGVRLEIEKLVSISRTDTAEWTDWLVLFPLEMSNHPDTQKADAQAERRSGTKHGPYRGEAAIFDKIL